MDYCSFGICRYLRLRDGFNLNILLLRKTMKLNTKCTKTTIKNHRRCWDDFRILFYREGILFHFIFLFIPLFMVEFDVFLLFPSKILLSGPYERVFFHRHRYTFFVSKYNPIRYTYLKIKIEPSSSYRFKHVVRRI